MKKLSIVLVMLALTAVVFANGAKENAPTSVEQGFGRGDGEIVTVSGTLDTTNEEVVLAAIEGKYTLSAPRARLLDLESFNELYLTVTGQLNVCDDCDDCTGEYDGHIFVESAIVDGEEYDFSVMGGRQGFSADFDREANAMGMRGKGTAEDYGRGNAEQDPRSGGVRDPRGTQDPRNMEDARGGGNAKTSGAGGRGRI